MEALLDTNRKADFLDLKEYATKQNFYKAEWPIIKQYLQAYQTGDAKSIAYFEEFGENIRQRVMNIRQYQKNLLFGVDNRELDHNGWLAVRGERIFSYQEEIAFKTQKDKADYNRVMIGRGANGKWAWGYSLSFGMAGEICGISEWGEVYTTREEAVKAALSFAKSKFEKASTMKYDRVNYNQSIIAKVLETINGLVAPKVQLSLF